MENDKDIILLNNYVESRKHFYISLACCEIEYYLELPYYKFIKVGCTEETSFKNLDYIGDSVYSLLNMYSGTLNEEGGNGILLYRLLYYINDIIKLDIINFIECNFIECNPIKESDMSIIESYMEHKEYIRDILATLHYLKWPEFNEVLNFNKNMAMIEDGFLNS